MKKIRTYTTSLLVATLVVGALFGCGGKTETAPADATEEAAADATEEAAEDATEDTAEDAATDAAADATEDTAEDAVEELKAAMAGVPAYQSVTATMTTVANSHADEPVTTVAKFDVGGEAPRASASTEFGDSTIRSYIDGDEAVVDMGDGVAYKGTLEETGTDTLTSVEDFVGASSILDFDTLIACVSSVEKQADGDTVRFVLTADPAKLAEADELIASLTEVGEKLDGHTVTYTFGADGRLVSIEGHQDASYAVTDTTVSFSDYDATTIDPAPEAELRAEDYEAMVDATFGTDDEAEAEAEAEE